MVILQRLFLCVLNPISQVIVKIPQKVRNCVICLCFMGIFLINIFHYTPYSIWNYMSQTNLALIGDIFIGIVVLMSMDKKMNLVPVNKIFSVLWFFCGFIIIFTSFIHPVGDGMRSLSLTMIFIFPCLWLVWANKNSYSKLCELATKGFCIVGGAYFVYCIIFMPLSSAQQDGRYLGATGNTNLLGMLCVVVLLSSLFLIFNGNKGIVFYVIIAGGANIFIILTVSRAALLCDILVTVAFFCFYLKTKVRNDSDNKKNIVKIFLILLVLILVVVVAVVTINQHSSKSQFDRLLVEDKTINDFSTGRVAIWKVYGQKLNFWGNDGNDMGVYVEDWHGVIMYGPHNASIEIAYKTGIVNGLIFLIIELLTGIYCVCYIFKCRYEDVFYLFSAMSILAFGIYATFDTALFPFSSPPTLVYYLGIGPIFYKIQR